METLTVALLIYFIPTFVAFHRKHHNKAAIAVLNLLGAWTGIGWIACLVWASTRVESRA